jgi:hypothetical protein
MRTAQMFPGLGWRNYDHAFRRHAAARNLLDWSALNTELFNFHISLGMLPLLSQLSPSPALRFLDAHLPKLKQVVHRTVATRFVE